MKAALTLLLASAATATPTVNCGIPTQYATATGNTCGGEVEGYMIWGVCISGVSPQAYNLVDGTNIARVRMTSGTTGNLAAFSTAATTGTATGCQVPSYANSWNAGITTPPLTTTAGLVTAAGDPRCNGWTAAGQTFSTTATQLKGVEVRCNRALGYYPTMGHEGTALCGSSQAVGPFPAPAVTTADYWFSAAYQAASYASANLGDAMEATQFSGTNMLTCAKGCTLPTSLCNNGVLSGNIVGAGNGFQLSSCTLLPTRTSTVLAMDATSFNFVCASGAATGASFTATCTTAGTTAATTYANQCGTADGASSPAVFGNGLPDTRTQVAGNIPGYPSVTSVLTRAYAVTANVNTAARRQSAVVAGRDGFAYNIAISGCEGFAEPERTLCVQRTLNWWRCYSNFPFGPGTVCYSNFAAIACPSHDLGFTCPSSSKKGLFGLLGLLGLIPLFLICCCLLFLCCIRRRKTEADVHFATFDPHAAPVMGTAACAPMTACGPVDPMMHTGSFAPATMPVM